MLFYRIRTEDEMKNVSISLTDQHAAALEAEIASGDYASLSEVVRAALREFFARSPGPDEAQMLDDFQEMQAGLERGDKLLDADEALSEVRRALAE